MNKIALPVSTLLVLLVLLIMHRHGISGHLYLNYWFYDLIAHFLGGVGIALSFYYISKNPKYIILITIFGGIIWELFEVYFDITGWPVSSTRYFVDTAKDLFMDFMGALFVWYIVRNKNKEQ